MNYKILGLSLLLLSCVGNGLIGVPKLNEGQTAIWHYSCRKSGIVVEYKLLGENYTAKIKVANGDIKVLTKESSMPITFSLSPWRWVSDDGTQFRLENTDKTILDRCIAMQEVESGSIQIKFNL